MPAGSPPLPHTPNEPSEVPQTSFRLSTSTPTTRGGVETAFRSAKLSTRSQSKRPGARQGGGRGVAGSGARRGAHGAATAGARSTVSLPASERASPPPGELRRRREPAGGTRGRRRRSPARRGRWRGAAVGLRARGSRGARRVPGRPPPGVFIQTPVAGETEVAKTAAEPARIPGNVSAAPRPTHASGSRLACARKARAREGGALPGRGGTRKEDGYGARARGWGRGARRERAPGACPRVRAGRVGGRAQRACAREGAGHSPGPDLQRGRGGSRNSEWGRARKGQGRGPGLQAVRAPAFGCLWPSVTALAR